MIIIYLGLTFLTRKYQGLKQFVFLLNGFCLTGLRYMIYADVVLQDKSRIFRPVFTFARLHHGLICVRHTQTGSHVFVMHKQGLICVLYTQTVFHICSSYKNGSHKCSLYILELSCVRYTYTWTRPCSSCRQTSSNMCSLYIENVSYLYFTSFTNGVLIVFAIHIHHLMCSFYTYGNSYAFVIYKQSVICVRHKH